MINCHKSALWTLVRYLSVTVVAALSVPCSPISHAVAAPAELPPPTSNDTYFEQDLEPESGFPGGAAISYMVGHTLLGQDNFRDALPYLQYAYRAYPDELSFGLAFLRCLLGIGDIDHSLNVLTKMRSAHPENTELMLLHVRVLTDSEQFGSALSVIRQLPTDTSRSTDLRVVEGGLLVKLGQYHEAIATYESGIRDFPDEAERFYMLLAALYEQQNRQEELTALLRDAVSALPAAGTLRLGLLGQLVYQDFLGEAREVAQAGNRLAAADTTTGGGAETAVDFLLELADICSQQGHFVEAADILLDRFETDDLDLDTSLWLVRLLRGMGRGEAALEKMPQIEQRWPNSGRAAFIWGRLLSDQDLNAEATVKFRQAVRSEPEVAEYRLALLRILIVVNQSVLESSAPDTLTANVRAEIGNLAATAALLVDENDSQGHIILGFAYRLLDDLHSAATHFEIAGNDGEDRLTARLQLALCMEDLGRRTDARRVLSDLWEEYPNDPEVANSYAYILSVLAEELDFAQQLVELALDAVPENAAYIDTLGWILYQKGDYHGAFDQLVTAANTSPENPVILEHLGLVLKALGQTDRALEVLRRCRSVGGDTQMLTEAIAELEQQ